MSRPDRAETSSGSFERSIASIRIRRLRRVVLFFFGLIVVHAIAIALLHSYSVGSFAHVSFEIAIFLLIAVSAIMLWRFHCKLEQRMLERTEEVLAVRKRFDDLATQVPALVRFTEPGDHCVYFNKAWERFVGKGMDELLGGEWSEHVHPDDREHVIGLYRAHSMSEQPLQIEYRLCRYDGEYRIMYDSASPRYNEDGEFLGFVGTLIDITDLRRAHSKTREAEKRFLQYADASPSLIWVSEPSGKVSFFNRSWCEHVGREMHEILGDDWLEDLHPDDRGRVFRNYKDSVKAGEKIRLEYRLRRHDGQYRMMLDIGSPRLDDEGNVIGFIGAAVDVHDMYVARRDAQEAREHLIETQQVARIGSFMIDAETGVATISDSCASILGINGGQAGEVRVEEVASRLLSEDREATLRNLYHDTRGKKEHTQQFRVLKDGKVKALIGRGKLVCKEGDPDRWIGSIQDITEQTEARQRIEDSERELQLVTTNAPVLIAYVRPDRTFRYTNAECHEWKGTNEDLKSLTGLLGDQGAMLFEPHLDHALNGNRSSFEVNFDDDHRHDITMQVNLAPDQRSDGLVQGVVMVAVDITQLELTREALRASEAKYRAIVEDQTEMICRFGADGTIVFANSAMVKAFECAAPNLEGKHFFSLFSKYQEGNREDPLERSGLDTIQFSEPVELRPDDHRWLEWTVRSIDADNNLDRSYQAVGRDITRRRLAELEVSKRIEVQSLLLKELDHRVKNSLAGLLTMIDLTASRETTLKEFAASARQRIGAMAGVHSILSETKWEPVPIHKLIMRMIPGDLSSIFELDGPETLISARQAGAFGMIFNELVANAMKYGQLESDNRVFVRWNVNRAENGSRKLELHWEEPSRSITAKPSPGLGTELVLGFARFELRGKFSFGYSEDGIHHLLEAKLDHLHDEDKWIFPRTFDQSPVVVGG
ncbi:MAG: PAS domain S-box protein [Planctomycetota bacterium]